jgi:hypothetical protein
MAPNLELQTEGQPQSRVRVELIVMGGGRWLLSQSGANIALAIRLARPGRAPERPRCKRGVLCTTC